MQFTKVFSIIALAVTGAFALPEPIPVTPVSANGTFSVVSDAATTVVVGLTNLNAANIATVHSLVETLIESVESDAADTVASITSIVGGTQAYADALTEILTSLSACVQASA